MDPRALHLQPDSLVRLGGTGETYSARTADGRRVVVKVHAAHDGSPAVSALERAVFARIHASGAGVAVPRPLEGAGTDDEPAEIDVECADGRRRRAVVTAFVPGTRWCDAPAATRPRYVDLGRVVGRVLASLNGLRHPAGARTHDWDLTQAGRHRANVEHVPDPQRRRVLERGFLLHASALPMLAGCPRQIIHGDVNDENVLVDQDRVVGLLDAGDAIENPAICELAIALAYAMLDADDPLEAGAAIVGACAAERPLREDELRVLAPLVCGRLSVTVAMAAKGRTIDPDHPTWFVTDARAWRLLERLVAIDPADLGTALARETSCDPFAGRGEPAARVLARRDGRISAALSVAYRDHDPLKIVQGRAQFLFDERGRPFLDLVNNVCHVGHCHPRVVEAGARQMTRLNTNTRYLSDLLVDYADRLCALLPRGLDTCFFVNSGSEANELALRLAMAHTGRHDVLVVDGAYHGNTRALVAASPYKFMGAGGSGRAEPWVHVVPLPDGYRGPFRGADEATGRAYATQVAEVIAASSPRPAAFITESLLSCGGQVVPPPGYLARAFDAVRAAGGVCIADEVQTGFGRVGRAFWAFELQGVVPDIVVLGKPMGNGHPMGAVITTRGVARSFETGMEFFSSFGGNPVSCAIGLAVLDVLRDEGLQEHALRLGTMLRDGLRALMPRHASIGDVRGEGLFIGVEIVEHQETRVPDAARASRLVAALEQRGLLTSTDGPQHNVIKIKPPMVIAEEDVQMVIRMFDEELG